MKSVAVVTLALLASASAFTAPHMATRAIGNPFAKKKAAKKVAAPAVSFLEISSAKWSIIVVRWRRVGATWEIGLIIDSI